eukprot:CAMPEP_0202967762 /NCGR_PEP_ID=MMETSP1396-20130829/12760_1 /ASSEMBLY_ACC=CAM_ASM_000872 /TAXON_ID= /ORGANISM="Pseudokeronopsis sp., Strain Brazil" /LENGTH=44 /DNA_ID= /DNA_START= /DNA_END= /DNA_ORIENTATION=
MASAYASIAELFMTELCDEDGAEEACEEAVQSALEIDSKNIDAL